VGKTNPTHRGTLEYADDKRWAYFWVDGKTLEKNECYTISSLTEFRFDCSVARGKFSIKKGFVSGKAMTAKELKKWVKKFGYTKIKNQVKEDE
jgi:hypothetical protein